MLLEPDRMMGECGAADGPAGVLAAEAAEAVAGTSMPAAAVAETPRKSRRSIVATPREDVRTMRT